MTMSTTVAIRPSIQAFKDALEGRIPYDSQLPAIQYWEDFLIQWVMADEFPEIELHLQVLFDAFRDSFAYNGTIWKGIWRKDKEPLLPMALSSYSSEKEVALWFVGASRVHGYYYEEVEKGMEQVIVAVEADRALALDELLRKVESLTTNDEIYEVFEKREWECEKVYPLTIENLNNSTVL